MKITKQRLKEIIKEEIGRLDRAMEPRGGWPTSRGARPSGPAHGGETGAAREVDHSSLEIEGIDHSDHPDYVDAYFSYGRYTDGTEMTDIELETLKEDNPDLFYKKLNEFLY